MKICKWGIVLILPFVFLIPVFFLTFPAYGQTDKIRVVYTEWFPYTFEDRGEASGFEIEIFKAVMERLNIDTEFQVYPWKRCLHNLKTGDADVLISLLKTPEREKYTYYPDTHISISRTVFFTTTGKNIQFNGSYEELKDFSIGVITGFSYGDAFNKAEYLKKEPVSNAELLIKKLLIGRNDLAAENQAVVSAAALKMGVKDKIQFLDPPIHTQRLFVGFSKPKRLKKMSEDFSQALGQFKNSQSYIAILEKYGLTHSDMTK